jgi:hypothetical protein
VLAQFVIDPSGNERCRQEDGVLIRDSGRSRRVFSHGSGTVSKGDVQVGQIASKSTVLVDVGARMELGKASEG